MGTRRVEVDLDMLGHGKIVIGDVDVSEHVARVTIDAQVNEPTRVYLEAAKGHEARAAVEALVLDRTSGSDEIVQFLQNVDPVALEAEALELLGLGGVESVPIAMLTVLQKWAIESVDDDGA